MKALKKTLVVGTSSIMALSGAGGVALAATQTEEAAPDVSAMEEATQQALASQAIRVDQVIGEFAFTQVEVAANDVIKKNIGEASKYLCGANVLAGEAEDAVQDWQISVSGAAGEPLSVTFEELAQSEEAQSQIMGCSCAGNLVDGRSSVNAEVTGLPVHALLDMVRPDEGANTIVFTSADGYRVELPLAYVQQRHSLLVFDVNGAPLAESVGGTNQLWLGSTAASYFARDIVSITLEERQTPPPSPNSDEAREAYQNLPNIGVLFGGDVR